MSRRYVVRRLVQGILAVVGILVITFAMVHFAPDPVHALGAGGDPANEAYLRSLLKLDRPLASQFATYVANVARGHLGSSFVESRPVVDIIAERLWPTLLLMTTALVSSTVGGIALGALAAHRPFGRVDAGVSILTLAAYAVPAFWLGQIAILTVALRTGLFPLQGITDARTQLAGWAHVVDIAHHLVLPALVLAVSEVALVARVTRSGLVQEQGKDYLRTARAKGLSERAVIVHHGLPNALLPVVTVVGSRVGVLLSGAVVIETVFSWPGLGSLIVSASQSGDRPVLLGMVLLVSFAVIGVNLLTDLAYGVLDPRIRYG